MMSKIISLINEKNYHEAEIQIQSQLKSNPNSFELNKFLAISLLAQKKYNSALVAFNKSQEIFPEDYDVNVNLSLLFNIIQDYKSSLKFSNVALQINSNRPEVHHNLANCYLYLSEFEKAEEHALKSIELRGGLGSIEIMRYKDTLNIYTDILLAKNNIEKFKEVCLEILDKDIYFGDIFRKLLRNDRSSITKKHLSIFDNILKDIDAYGNLLERNLTKAGIYSCLAEYNQKLDQNISEDYYVKANQLISDLQRDSLFNRQEKTKKIIKIFNELNLESLTKDIPGNRGEGLIFVFGMPRSGTTLTESIIASSNDSMPGGEKVFFHIQCSPIISSYQSNGLTAEVLNNLGKNYLEIIEIQRKGKKFFIDKMPENYLYFNFIKAALPAAKFIHVSRNPWDNAISLFKQNFAKELFYASSFFGIAVEYANYEQIMKVWASQNNSDILHISYDDLVKNTNSIIDKIWDFCGLEGKYDENVRKKHFSQTASKFQVTQDIYSTSINKEEFLNYRDDFFKDLENQRLFWKKY